MSLTPTNTHTLADRVERAEGASRPWLPSERNYSGNRVGVWHQGEWTMLRVETSVADATMSIRQHEAWDLALRLSPALSARLDELFANARAHAAANYALTWRGCQTDLLRREADARDCGPVCEFAGLGGNQCSQLERDGCGRAEADELRELAAGIDLVNDYLLQRVLLTVDSCGGAHHPDEAEFGRGWDAALEMVEAELRKLLAPPARQETPDA